MVIDTYVKKDVRLEHRDTRINMRPDIGRLASMYENGEYPGFLWAVNDTMGYQGFARLWVQDLCESSRRPIPQDIMPCQKTFLWKFADKLEAIADFLRGYGEAEFEDEFMDYDQKLVLVDLAHDVCASMEYVWNQKKSDGIFAPDQEMELIRPSSVIGEEFGFEKVNQHGFNDYEHIRVELRDPYHHPIDPDKIPEMTAMDLVESLLGRYFSLEKF